METTDFRRGSQTQNKVLDYTDFSLSNGGGGVGIKMEYFCHELKRGKRKLIFTVICKDTQAAFTEAREFRRLIHS